MLINLSNHPKANWDQLQQKTAEAQFGLVEDLNFPQIDPNASLSDVILLVREYVEKCCRMLAQAEKDKHHAIHIMGEFTFTYQFLKEMEHRGILCIASTTERLVKENPDGTFTTTFNFVRFRPYFEF